ncbi:unnamed protein product [Onchocerca flexuosa]|uniref:Uncharacterized protein n=1 Tax=Onchocerca flexuosa TaxID=387005 RepID=A0A183HZ23_9BILA|nr:unnamed protein product [Onchocerca flexuosa]
MEFYTVFEPIAALPLQYVFLLAFLSVCWSIMQQSSILVNNTLILVDINFSYLPLFTITTPSFKLLIARKANLAFAIMK